MAAKIRVLGLMVCLVVVTGGGVCRGQGALDPEGAPAPMMKTLEQVEPRTAITNVPYEINESGSYYLTGNLYTTNGGITIRAHYVTLDLMGYSLAGDYIYSETGLYLAGTNWWSLEGIVVKNGFIRGFRDGVLLEYVDGAVLENLAIHDNSNSGITLSAFNGRCNGNTIRNCSIMRAGLDRGLLFNADNGECSYNRIEGCNIMSNRMDGIEMRGASGRCCGNVIQDSYIVGNGDRAIYVNASYAGTCMGNSIINCIVERHEFRGGILFFAGSGSCNGNVITKCRINENSPGISMDGDTGECEGSRIEDCVLRGNSGYGIYLANTRGSRIAHNHVQGTVGSAAYGIMSTSSVANLIYGNSCMNQTNGFYVESTDIYGPIVTNLGEMSASGAGAHPWANFAY